MSSGIYLSRGRLRYSEHDDVGHKLIVEVDPGIVELYRSLIPKYYTAYPQAHAAHISVVRKELPAHLEHWEKYQGEEIEFFYSPEIHESGTYWWLNAFCVRLEEIRVELGLPISSRYTRPPDGFSKCFHITLANKKPRP